MSKISKKDKKKKLKEKLKLLKKARGLRNVDKIPPNKVIPDKKKENNKNSTRSDGNSHENYLEDLEC